MSTGIAPDLTVRSPDPGLYNDDIRPTTASERHWSVYDMASLWVGMVVCVPTYMIASGLIKAGMSWSQAVFTIALGNLVVLVPMVLNGHPGTKYGVPFPVLARSAFGTRGAHVPSLLRALVACGWFGINTWVGGSAIYQLVNAAAGGALATAPLPVLGINAAELVCFFVFWALQLVILFRGMEMIRKIEAYSAPFLIASGLALLAWGWYAAGGWEAMLSKPSAFDPGGAKEGQFWATFFPSLTAMVGFWATLALNIPDFTRYAKSQRDQWLGQAIGLPTTMTLFAFIGVAVTSASEKVFGEAIWDPTVLCAKIGGPAAILISLLALTLATLSTNIAANVVSPANALINVDPQRIGFKFGALVTAILGVVIMPWKLVADPSGYIFTWLVGYSALLGPIGGILVADYYVVRRTNLDLDGLYRENGPYTYAGGFNVVSIVALVLGVLPNVPGFLHQVKLVGSVPGVFDTIYTYAWFVGFGISGVLYTLGMLATAPAARPASAGLKETP
jgi:NCS1 family nucleobase:cation symporter-1